MSVGKEHFPPQPTKGPLAALSEEEFRRFIVHVGAFTWNSLATAAFARHVKPSHTVRDYLDVEADGNLLEALATEFVRDVVGGTKRVEELARRWHDSTPGELATLMAEWLDKDK